MSTPLVDSHCHLDFADFHGREAELLAAMETNGVGWALIAGVTLERFPDVLTLTGRFPNLYAAVGVHPDTQGGEEADEGTLIRLAKHPKVVAIAAEGSFPKAKTPTRTFAAAPCFPLARQRKIRVKRRPVSRQLCFSGDEP